MSHSLRCVAVAVLSSLALGAGAAPGLARATPSTGAGSAPTRLTALMTKWTPELKLRYDTVGTNYGDNASNATTAAIAVGRVHADAAQLPAQLEFVLGARVLRRGDDESRNALRVSGTRKHSPASTRLFAAAHADYRLSNYFLADADSQLGISHPEYFAAPYQPVKGKPIDTTPPLIAAAPRHTLTAMIEMATPLLQQTIPMHVGYTYVGLSQAAAAFASVTVGRLNVDAARRPGQQAWVDGVRALAQADAQLSAQTEHGFPLRPAAQRAIRSALTVYHRADAEIAHADSLLGVRQTGPTVRFPATISYHY